MDAPQSDPLLPLALTMGDAAGIGPELAILAWRDRKRHGLSPFAIYADLDLMRGVASTVGTGLPVSEISDARESVRTVNRGRAAGDDFDPRNQRRRNGVQVDRAQGR